MAAEVQPDRKLCSATTFYVMVTSLRALNFPSVCICFSWTIMLKMLV